MAATASAANSDRKKANLVLEGGGVKGIGLVGAVLELDAAGYTFPRVAGTSAGAICATLIAAIQAAGAPLSTLEQRLTSIKYTKFMEESTLRRLTGKVGDVAALLHDMGLYSGDYLETWLGGILGELGITKFGQLRNEDLHGSPYSLIVHTADITRSKLVRLPWDYPAYDMKPDDQQIVKAVRASMSIPFFFVPVQHTIDHAYTYDGHQYAPHTVTWVDGGLLSNFPMEVFSDTETGVSDEWPTIGIKLSARDADMVADDDTNGPFDETMRVLKTVLNNANRYYVPPDKAKNTIFIDSAGIDATDFAITDTQCAQLLANGREAAKAWLAPLPPATS